MSRVRRHAITVSLFPFLAVLICIMGALVIILVLMVARVGDGATVAAAAAGFSRTTEGDQDPQKLRERLEDAQWRRELIENSRAEKSQELADKRAELSHFEDHIQRLQAQAKELLERAKSIDEGRQLRAEDIEKARQELARLKKESAEKRLELVEKAKKQQLEPRSYTLIPYDGPNGTRRRPIYIECDEQGITIQPEGVVFRADDFQGPLGPGNPLDAALRAIRERLGQGGGKEGEPYPLLVVRPKGVVAYAAARAALKSWDDEFGYELIGDDKRLDFGQADPTSAAALASTVKMARQRQAMLAAAMPRTFNGDALTSFVDEPGTGRGGGGGGYGSPGQPGAGGSSSGYGGPGGGGTGGGGTGGGGYGGGGYGGGGGGPTGGGGGGGGGGGYGGGRPGSDATFSGIGSAGGGVSNGGGTGAGGSMGGSAAGGSSSAGAGAAGMAAGTKTGSGIGGSSTGMLTVDPTTPGSAAAHTDAARAGGSPGHGKLDSSGSGMPQRGTANGPTVGLDAAKMAPRGDSGKPRKSNLPNWALPQAKVNSIGVTRPIQVAVLNDRLVIIPERGDDRRPQEYRISPHVSPSEVDAFVTGVQKEMQGWGLAVQNGHWKPQLILEVAPEAEQQCRELQTALQNSGFEMQRKLR